MSEVTAPSGRKLFTRQSTGLLREVSVTNVGERKRWYRVPEEDSHD